MMSVYLHELKQNWKLLTIWTAVVAGMNFVIMFIYPEMAGQTEEVMDIYGNLGAFSDAFGMNRLNLGSALGFYGVEGGAMISIGGGMLAGLLGSGILCKEEGKHTAEFLMTMPVRRQKVALQKLAAVCTLVMLFNLVCTSVVVAAFAVIGESLDGELFWKYHFAQLVMQLEIGCICFGISAFLRKVSVGAGIGVALLLYFQQMFVNISEDMEWLKYITPYYYSDASYILAGYDMELGIMIWGVLLGIVATAVGTWWFGRKDLMG